MSQPYQLFDPLRPEVYGLLKADIAKHGIKTPIDVDETGAILDGHHRSAIAAELGIDCPRTVRTFASEQEKREYVLMANMARRQLDHVSWARAFAQLLDLRGVQRGAGKRNDLTCATVAQVAAELGVPKRTAYDRLALLALPEPQQAAIAAGEIGIKEAKRQASKEARIAERMIRAAALDGAAGVLPDGPFEVIYADPPWRYEHVRTESRAIENHYPTMSLEEICALDVAGLCADDAILYLWAPAPKSAEAMKVIEAWGFVQRAQRVWNKGRPGMGYWTRVQHENLWIAIRGSFPSPYEADRPASVFDAPRREHSRKPEQVYDDIERAHPGTRKVELFARQARSGWAAWGAEVEAA